MPAPDIPALTAEIMELHADALEAARVAQLCQVAAGQRLNEIRDSMRAIDWHKWVRSDACPLPQSLVARYMVAAQDGASTPA